jgi:hypothetical protein
MFRSTTAQRGRREEGRMKERDIHKSFLERIWSETE